MNLIGRDATAASKLLPRIPKLTFLGIGWGGTGVALFFLLGRIATRLHVHRTLYMDDFFVTVSWVFLLVNTIIWQVAADDLYEDLYVIAGLRPHTLTVASDTLRFLRLSVVVLILFFTGLWFVKLSFLIFFRRLGSRVRNQKVHWWLVAGLTLATWIAIIGTIPYRCLLGSWNYVVSECALESAVKFQRATLKANMVMDVVTDAAIITIPVHLLWNVRISMKRKLALLSIFSLTVFIIIVAIVRATVVAAYSEHVDQSWLYMWSSVEQSVSIIIAGLASFRSLFVKQESASRRQAPSSDWRSGSGSRSARMSLSTFFTIFKSRQSCDERESAILDENDETPTMAHRPVNAQDSENLLTDDTPHKGTQVRHQVSTVSQPREVVSKQRNEV